MEPDVPEVERDLIGAVLAVLEQFNADRGLELDLFGRLELLDRALNGFQAFLESQFPDPAEPVH